MERRRGDPAVRTDRNSRRVFKRVWQGQEAGAATSNNKVPTEREPAAEEVTTPVPEPADDSEGKTAVSVEPPQQEPEENQKAKASSSASSWSSSSQPEVESPSQQGKKKEDKEQPHHMPVYHRHDEWKWGGADDTIASEGDGSGSRNPWA